MGQKIVKGDIASIALSDPRFGNIQWDIDPKYIAKIESLIHEGTNKDVEFVRDMLTGFCLMVLALLIQTDPSRKERFKAEIQRELMRLADEITIRIKSQPKNPPKAPPK